MKCGYCSIIHRHFYFARSRQSKTSKQKTKITYIAREITQYQQRHYAYIMAIVMIRQNKMLSYRRETALQGALQFSPKVEDWNWETIFYGHYRSIFNYCDIIGMKVYRIRCKKTQNNGYYCVQGHSRSSRSVSPYATSYK